MKKKNGLRLPNAAQKKRERSDVTPHFIKHLVNVSFMITAALAACSPVSISHIGPALPSRGKGCEVVVFPPGEEPPRPYRDIGVVHLTNCQEYTWGPCKQWLIDGVCELGGNLAYLPDPVPPKNEFDAVNYHVTAGVYINASSAETTEDVTCEAPPPDETAPEMGRCVE
jgi:hypothetical protein